MTSTDAPSLDKEAVPEGPPEHRLIRGLRAVDNVIATLESWFLMLALLALIGVAIYKALAKSSAWPTEIICYLLFFIGLIGGALATQERRLFNIDFVSHFMPRALKLVSRILAGLFVFVMCFFLIRGGLLVRANVATELGEIIPPATAALAMPVAGTLIALHVLLQIILDSYTLATGRPVIEQGPVV
jgi:TRAP-type C4-dicarboxylate transport system permease small subunit